MQLASTRQDVLANPESQVQGGDDTAVCLAGCNKMCGTDRMHWLCCFVFAIFMLLLSILLWQMYIRLKDDDVNDSDPQGQGSSGSAGGSWEFVRLCYIFGFTTTSVLFMCCGWVYCRNPNSRSLADVCPAGMCAPGACECACAMPGVSGDCCSGGGSGFSCPACEMPKCDCGGSGGVGCGELPACDCSLPSCSCDCLPDCSGMGECCSTVYKIVCCQCKIQVG